MTTRTDPWQALLFDTLLALWTLEATQRALTLSIHTAQDLVADASSRMDAARVNAVTQGAMDMFAIRQRQVTR